MISFWSLPRRRYLVGLLFLLSALWVRTWAITRFALNSDEIAKFQLSNVGSFSEVLRLCYVDPAHPPFGFFLHHFLFRAFGAEPMIYRLASLLPGLATPFVFLALGTLLCDFWLGAVLTFLATFSYGLVLQAQVARHYSMLVLLNSLTLLYFVRFFRTGRRGDAFFYGATLALALGFHYSAGILAGALFVAGGIECWRSQGRPQFLCRFLAAYIPVLAVFIFCWISHLRYVAFDFARPKGAFLYSWIASNENWDLALRSLVGFLFWPWQNMVYDYGVCALTAFGIGALWRFERPLASACLFLLLSAIVLFVTGLYPLGLRQSLYLFPAVVVPVGYAILVVARRLRVCFESFFPSIRSQSESARCWASFGAVLIIFAAAVVARSTLEARKFYLNGSEFHFEQNDLTQMLATLHSVVQPGDRLFIDLQTKLQLEWHESPLSPISRSLGLKALRWRSADLYETESWDLKSSVLEHLLCENSMQRELAKKGRNWFLHLGWTFDDSILKYPEKMRDLGFSLAGFSNSAGDFFQLRDVSCKKGWRKSEHPLSPFALEGIVPPPPSPSS